jgi:hypothetical protein
MDNYGNWIEISSNQVISQIINFQYFVPFLKENPHYSKFIQRMFPSGDIFSIISNFLYHPVDSIQNKIDSFLKKFENKKLIGIQIRHNEKENQIIWPKGHHEKYFWNCAKENILSQHKDYKIFVVSDNSTTKFHAKEAFGEDNVIYMDNVYRDSGWYLNGRDKLSVIDALGEMFAFTKCSEFIVSQWYSFMS